MLLQFAQGYAFVATFVLSGQLWRLAGRGDQGPQRLLRGPRLMSGSSEEPAQQSSAAKPTQQGVPVPDCVDPTVRKVSEGALGSASASGNPSDVPSFASGRAGDNPEDAPGSASASDKPADAQCWFCGASAQCVYCSSRGGVAQAAFVAAARGKLIEVDTAQSNRTPTAEDEEVVEVLWLPEVQPMTKKLDREDEEARHEAEVNEVKGLIAKGRDIGRIRLPTEFYVPSWRMNTCCICHLLGRRGVALPLDAREETGVIFRYYFAREHVPGEPDVGDDEPHLEILARVCRKSSMCQPEVAEACFIWCWFASDYGQFDLKLQPEVRELVHSTTVYREVAFGMVDPVAIKARDKDVAKMNEFAMNLAISASREETADEKNNDAQYQADIAAAIALSMDF